MSLNFQNVPLNKVSKIMTEIGVTVSEIFVHSVRGRVSCCVFFACSIHQRCSKADQPMKLGDSKLLLIHFPLSPHIIQSFQIRLCRLISPTLSLK